MQWSGGFPPDHHSMLAVAPSLPPDDDAVPLDAAYAVLRQVISVADDTERVPLERVADRVVADPIHSLLALPPFDHSAVDGYGLTASDLQRPGTRLDVVGRGVAGVPFHGDVGPGQCAYLATGAAIPPGVSAVVMRERTTPMDGAISTTELLSPGDNIRRAGEDVEKGSIIVPAGTLADYRHVAIMAAAGHAEIVVRRRIRVGLGSTGDEVRPQGDTLLTGQIYDVNGPMLEALLQRGFIESRRISHVADDPARLTAMVIEATQSLDVLITTGGAAGSDTDHIQAAIMNAGGTSSHLRLALRPGKPIIIGRVGACVVLGLPGNPLAALANFLLFARPAILAMAGLPLSRPRGQPVAAAEIFAHRRGRTEFAPARIIGRTPDGRTLVERTGRGGSARLRPLVESDGFVELSAEVGDVAPGESVLFHPFSASFAP